MKLAVFVEHLPPKMGSDRRIFEIMKRLTANHEIHFIIFPSLRMLLGKIGQGKDNPHFEMKDLTQKYEGIVGHFVPIPRRIAALWKYSQILAYALTSFMVFVRTTIILKKLNPDVIVINYPSPYTGLLGFLEGKLQKKIIVIDFNDLIAQYTIVLLGLNKEGFKAKMLIFTQNFLVKHSHKVIAPTKFIEKYAISLGVSKERISLIPNGVDPKIFKSNGDGGIFRKKFGKRVNGEKICVYCGRLDEWAGVNIITKLCEAVKAKNLAVRFVVVGSGPAQSLCGESITLLGEVPYKNVPAILTAADVILVPFPNNEVSHAASPLKLFEGMAMKKPIIASRVSGIEEVILDGENGFLADPDDINEWIKKLEIILKSGKVGKKVAENARRTVEEKFDWNLIANQFDEALKSCI
ncbi:MAG: glycosyltransferase family 4 protein [Candidatus Bathyarchaeia archaeon]